MGNQVTQLQKLEFASKLASMPLSDIELILHELMAEIEKAQKEVLKLATEKGVKVSFYPETSLNVRFANKYGLYINWGRVGLGYSQLTKGKLLQKLKDCVFDFYTLERAECRHETVKTDRKLCIHNMLEVVKELNNGSVIYKDCDELLKSVFLVKQIINKLS